MAAALTIRDGANVARTVTALVIRDETNTPRTIQQLWVRDATNTPRLVYSTAPALSASRSPSAVSGGSFATGTATTNSTTVTPSGGTAPYTYAWTLISHSSATLPMIGSAAAATTTFTQTGLGSGASEDASFNCTVTDSTPGTPQTASASVFASFVDYA